MDHVQHEYRDADGYPEHPRKTISSVYADYCVGDGCKERTVDGRRQVLVDAHWTNVEKPRRWTRPLHDLVVLHFPELPKEHEVAGTGVKLALPDDRFFNRSTRDATVIAVGPGRWEKRGKRQVFEPTTLRPGDRVLLDAVKTQAVGLFLDEWDGDRGDYRIVRESDVDLVLDSETRVEVA